METNVVVYCLSEARIGACRKCSKYGTDEFKSGDCRMEALYSAFKIVEKYQKIEKIMLSKDFMFSNTVKLEEILKIIKGYDSFLFSEVEDEEDTL